MTGICISWKNFSIILMCKKDLYMYFLCYIHCTFDGFYIM
nr:unnamed protein product [Callosobruchus chinensis]